MTIRFLAAVILFVVSGFCFNQSIKKTVSRTRHWAIPVGLVMILLEVLLLTSSE